jgi:ArsR family transcriptional regulator
MKEIIRAFKALSDPTRLRIFFLLLKRDLCVCELTFILEMSQSRISHQLRLLRDADLVQDKREGKWIIYSIPPRGRESVEPLVRQLAGPEFAATEAVLADAERLDLCLRENIRKKRDEAVDQSSV